MVAAVHVTPGRRAEALVVGAFDVVVESRRARMDVWAGIDVDAEPASAATKQTQTADRYARAARQASRSFIAPPVRRTPPR
jgi:hypothetical protein